METSNLVFISKVLIILRCYISAILLGFFICHNSLQTNQSYVYCVSNPFLYIVELLSRGQMNQVLLSHPPTEGILAASPIQIIGAQ